MNKALITGIGGFAGSHLSSFLRKSGNQVFGIERRESDDKNVFQCDILDYSAVLKIMKEVMPNTIFHLAAQSSVKKSWDSNEDTHDINVKGTENILRAVAEAGCDSIVIIVSSGEVYGTNKNVPFTETSETMPNSPYSQSKLAQENIGLKFFRENGLKIIVTRAFPHTGPGQTPEFVCSEFAKKIAEIEKGKREFIDVGNLDAERDYTDVRDIVKAYALCAEKCVPGEIYNISSGEAVSIKKILDTLRSFSDFDIVVKQNHDKMRLSDIPILLGGSSKFREITGWEPSIKIEDTLKEMLEYWRERT